MAVIAPTLDLPSASALRFLAFELPDPYEELFVQVRHTTFTCSGWLPWELPEEIWRETFPPGREVHWALQSRRDEGEHYPPLPISLRICKEGHKETIRHSTSSFNPPWSHVLGL
jgi:hypothetical protein